MRTILVLGAAIAALAGIAPWVGAQPLDPSRERPCTAWFEPTYDRENVIFPDKATRYFGVNFVIPPGGYVEVTGDFPHARYFSLQTATNSTQTIMSLPDYQMVPDEGSLNPFLAGAHRDMPNRRFTVRIVHGNVPPPGERAPNTLYDSTPSGQPGNILAYRLYLADRDAGTFGGVHLPQLALVTATGTRIPIPDCPDLLPDTSGPSDTAGAQAPPPAPESIPLGANPPNWHKLVSVPVNFAYDNLGRQGIPPGTRDTVVDAIRSLGFDALGASADNAYLYAYGTRNHGRVLLVTARLPETPKTFDGEPIMGSGQMRYWSMCTGEPLPPEPTWDCKYDEQVPVDRDGNFRIAVSAPTDRPKRARTGCGIAWLAWGPDVRNLMAIRNQLPAPDFTESVQSAELGHEQETMGPYYPSSQYYATPEDFDRTVACDRQAGHSPGRRGPSRAS